MSSLERNCAFGVLGSAEIASRHESVQKHDRMTNESSSRHVELCLCPNVGCQSGERHIQQPLTPSPSEIGRAFCALACFHDAASGEAIRAFSVCDVGTAAGSPSLLALPPLSGGGVGDSRELVVQGVVRPIPGKKFFVGVKRMGQSTCRDRAGPWQAQLTLVIKSWIDRAAWPGWGSSLARLAPRLID